MKKIAIIISFTFSCSVFAQVQKQEIELKDEQEKVSFIKFNETSVGDGVYEIKDFLRKQYLFDQHVDFEVKNEQRQSNIRYQKLQQYYKASVSLGNHQTITQKIVK